MPSQHKGHQGELLAERYLKKTEKLRILERNWRCPLGEIDLIAEAPDKTLVFIEVKTRTGDRFPAWEALGIRKQKKLRSLALYYLKKKSLPLETSLRFDAVAVDIETQKITHLESAFAAEKEI